LMLLCRSVGSSMTASSTAFRRFTSSRRLAERGPHPACRPPSPIASQRAKGMEGLGLFALMGLKRDSGFRRNDGRGCCPSGPGGGASRAGKG
jgi:hypothetical protein